MSWLEGETDVLEKLHGALTEVGLPACETTDVQECKTTERATTTINKQSLCQRVNLSDEADPRLYRKNEGASENKHIRRQMKKITQDGHRGCPSYLNITAQAVSAQQKQQAAAAQDAEETAERWRETSEK